jgi:drug/metabolite transporter (DMT)-like permease
MIGIGVGFIGTMMVLLTTSPNEQMLIAWRVFSYPELAALGALAIGRLGWILVQKLLKRDRYSVPEINGVTMIVSGIGSLALSIYWQEVSFSQLSFSHYKVLAALAWTIIIGNVFGYSLYARALRAHSATLVSLAGFSVPIFVYLFGWLLLGEPLSWYFIGATAITFIGLLIFYHAEIVKGLSR